MPASPLFDTTNLHALRRELDRLNAAALASGLIEPVKIRTRPLLGEIGAPSSKKSAQKGKAAARRLLSILHRVEGDASPAVPGTAFTEGGVVRLLVHLRTRRARSQKFLQRLLVFLTRPVARGIQLSAGIGVERLQTVSRLLIEIDRYGWDHAQSRRAVRRAVMPAVASRLEALAIRRDGGTATRTAPEA